MRYEVLDMMGQYNCNFRVRNKIDEQVSSLHQRNPAEKTNMRAIKKWDEFNLSKQVNQMFDMRAKQFLN